MAAKNNNYDFHYSGETNMIVFAVENDDYYSFMLQADAARTVDLSGGTRCIETIKFQKCHKMSRIIWPYDTSTIRSLSIYAAETLTKLDLTPLTNLEALSILDCPALTTLTGLPKELKIINLHNTHITRLDLQHVSEITTVNIHTTLENFKFIAEQRNYLQHVRMKSTGSTKSHLQCNLTNCATLHDVYIDAEKTNVKLNIKNSGSLKELTVIAGDNSSVFGLTDCKQIKYIHTTSPVILKDIEAALLEQRAMINSQEMEYSLNDQARKFHEAQLQFQIDAAAHNPHFDDKETVIQHINSRREFEQGIGATLSLLSHPMEHVIEISQHDLRKMKKLSNDSRPQFLVESTLTPFYIMDSDLCPHPARLIKNAKTSLNCKDPVGECIASDSILLITDRDFTNKPLLKKFLQLLRNPLYKNRIVFVAGKLAVMNKLIRGFSRKVMPVQLPTQTETEKYFYQGITDDISDIVTALALAEDNAEALTAAASFTTAMHANNIDMDLPLPNNSKRWPAPGNQYPIDGAALRARPEPDPQVLIGGAKHKERSMPDDQKGINAASADPASKSPIQMTWPYEQSVIEGNAEHSPALKPVAPLIPEHTNDQIFFAANRRLKEPLPEAPKFRAEIHPQVLLEGDAEHKERPILTPDDQIGINATAKYSAALKTIDPLIPEQTNDQMYLAANEKLKEDLQEAPKLILDDTNEQMLLQANRKASDNKLLNAARDLAIATQHLVDAAVEKHNKSEQLQRAETLIKTVARELVQVKQITLNQTSAPTSMHKEDFYTAARNLTDGIKKLADVCRLELNLKPEPAPDAKLKENIKKNE